MGINKTQAIIAGMFGVAGLAGLLGYKSVSKTPKKTIDFNCNAVPPSMRGTKEKDYLNPFKLVRTDNLSGWEKLNAKMHNAAAVTFNPAAGIEHMRSLLNNEKTYC